MKNSVSPKPASDGVSRRMSVTPQKDTSAEMAVRKRLHGMGFRYRVDYPILKKPRRVADIVFPGIQIAIFVDGCFWHGCPEHGTWPKRNADFWRNKILTNQARDKDTDERLTELGWTVIRIWEHEDPENAAQKIARSVIVAKNNV